MSNSSNEMSLIHRGDIVKVNAETECPDFEGLQIGGWVGKAIRQERCEEGRLILVIWSKRTISSMPQEFVEDGDKKKLHNNLMWLYETELSVIKRAEQICVA